MIFVNNYPRDTGASDMMDSARLAGLMALFNHPMAYKEMLEGYELGDGMIARCPVAEHEGDWCENPFNATRDQVICLAAGLYKLGMFEQTNRILRAHEARGWRAQNVEYDKPGSSKKFPNGADWLSPSHRNHLRLCAGQKPTHTGSAWLWQDIVYGCYVDPWHEPNQLISMMVVAGPKYVQWWKAHHPDWKKSLQLYWDGWRGEKAFCELMIMEII